MLKTYHSVLLYKGYLSTFNVLDILEEACDLPEYYYGGYKDWGINRKSKDNRAKSRGFPWTVNEIKIVRDWKSSNPNGNIKSCLEYIYAHKEFRVEFHSYHVVNTARLHTAWKMC